MTEFSSLIGLNYHCAMVVWLLLLRAHTHTQRHDEMTCRLAIIRRVTIPIAIVGSIKGITWESYSN